MADTAPVKKKRGKASDFQGSRAKYLESLIPKYKIASKAKKNPETWANLWVEVFSGYWKRFPWRLPLNQEPDESNPTNYGLEPQNEAEEAEKEAIMQGIHTVSGAF